MLFAQDKVVFLAHDDDADASVPEAVLQANVCCPEAAAVRMRLLVVVMLMMPVLVEVWLAWLWWWWRKGEATPSIPKLQQSALRATAAWRAPLP